MKCGAHKRSSLVMREIRFDTRVQARRVARSEEGEDVVDRFIWEFGLLRAGRMRG